MNIKQARKLIDTLPGKIMAQRMELGRLNSMIVRLEDAHQRAKLKLKQRVRQELNDAGKPRFSSDKARDEETQRRLYATASIRRRVLRLQELLHRKEIVQAELDSMVRHFRAALATLELEAATSVAGQAKKEVEHG